LPNTNDRTTVLAVVILLGVLAILGLLSAAVLIGLGRPAADIGIVVALGTGPGGALAALLASTATHPVSGQSSGVIDVPSKPAGETAPRARSGG
jgi:hypothetical protein